MATLNVYLQVKGTFGAKEISLGRSGNPYAVTAGDGVTHEAVYSLATATNKVILNVGSAATDDIGSFDFVYILSNQDLSLEIMATTQADNGNVTIEAGVPFILANQSSRAYAAAGVFAGAAQNITKLTVRNDSGSTATIEVFAAT